MQPIVKYGINVVSLMHLNLLRPWGFCLASLEHLMSLAARARYDFCQILPLRGSSGHEADLDFSRYFEDAWNAGSLWDLLLRHPGSLGVPPTLKDVALFPNPKRCAQAVWEWEHQGAIRIRHRFDRVGSLVEVYPGMATMKESIIETCQLGRYRLVIDTAHLRRGFRSDEIKRLPAWMSHSPLGTTMPQWLETLEILAPFSSGVLHLHLDDARRFAGGGDSENRLILSKWLDLHRDRKKIEIILEYRPPSLLPWTTLTLAKRVLTAAKAAVAEIYG